MKLSQQSQACIESLFRKAVSRYLCDCNSSTVLSDIHVQPNPETGELIIYDDDEEVLAEGQIEEFKDYQGVDFYVKVERVFKTILSFLNEQGIFDNLLLLKPYSFVLIDLDKESVAELLLVDDDTLVVDDELLKGLDKELDDFLAELLAK